MHDQLQRLIDDLPSFAQLDARWRAELRRRAEQVQVLDWDEGAAMLAALAELAAADREADALRNDHGLWSILLRSLGRLFAESAGSAAIPPAAVERAIELYRQLGAASQARHELLGALANSGRPEALAAFAELVVADPPARAQDAVLAFVPFFQRQKQLAPRLFPRLLDALEHPSTAAVVLDLANFLTRQRLAAPHPASARVERLAALLGGLTSRLARLEEHPEEFAPSPAALHALVAESVDLVVGLCHALAMIGDVNATGKLRQTLELSHRRLRTEAAFALAGLKDERGVEVLAEMAAEPVARARALAYLEELGLISRAREADRSPAARAEVDLAAWLASPVGFGMPPQKLELFDTCRQFWPGYDDEVDCYLFRYEYRMGGQKLSGIAMAGPITHALRADLEDLPPADSYALYAGWCAEHESIGQLTPEQLSLEQHAEWLRLQDELIEQGCEDVRLVKLGRFFGEEHFVATARRREQAGVLIADQGQIDWHPLGFGSRPLGPDEFYDLHLGRKLLRAFNPGS
ncbi:MAG TPA: hypothetical protein VMV10_09530 [Pirellulales bacterium]|nr:hypothetical protein [Pirellulales bacterium]